MITYTVDGVDDSGDVDVVPTGAGVSETCVGAAGL
jgi:hypothetical protein